MIITFNLNKLQFPILSLATVTTAMSNIYLLKQSAVPLLIIFCVFINLPTMTSIKLLSTEFEVFGRVQGVFFRKYTQQEAKKLGLKGWCMNTDSGTVKGVIEGDANKLADMKRWLQTTGSPQSRIDKAEFSNEKEISKYSYDSFKIKR